MINGAGPLGQNSHPYSSDLMLLLGFHVMSYGIRHMTYVSASSFFIIWSLGRTSLLACKGSIVLEE